MQFMSVSSNRLLSPGEVAELFAVDPKTVTRWANAGLVPHFKTPGGHRRYRWSDLAPLVTPERS